MLAKTPKNEIAADVVARAIEKAIDADRGFPDQARAAVRNTKQEAADAEVALAAAVRAHPVRHGFDEPLPVLNARRAVEAARADAEAARSRFAQAKADREHKFTAAAQRALAQSGPEIAEAVATWQDSFAPILRMAAHARMHGLSVPRALAENEREIAAGLLAMRRLANAYTEGR